jgi:hypothetical protein
VGFGYYDIVRLQYVGVVEDALRVIAVTLNVSSGFWISRP